MLGLMNNSIQLTAPKNRRISSCPQIGAFMRKARLGAAPLRLARRMLRTATFAVLAISAFLGAPCVLAQQGAPPSSWVEELVSAVVRIKTHINPDGRTVEGLGRE